MFAAGKAVEVPNGHDNCGVHFVDGHCRCARRASLVLRRLYAGFENATVRGIADSPAA
jgi:hypothetical protein